MPAHTRHAWSFQAVLSGSVVADVPGTLREPARRSLWFFPPGSSHGWTAEPGTKCEIGVAHFDHIAPSVEEALRDLPVTRVALNTATIAKLRRGFAELLPCYARPRTRSGLLFDRLQVDLALLTLEGTGRDRPLQEIHARTVTRALGWYSARMADRPTVAEVAKAVGCSVSHLRRHFAAANAPSPLHEMRRLQADRAASLLRQTDEPLSRIAYVCGYGSPSAFSRSFSAITGRPPSSLRPA